MRQFQKVRGGWAQPGQKSAVLVPWWPGRLEPGRAMVFCWRPHHVTSDSGSWDRKGDPQGLGHWEQAHI